MAPKPLDAETRKALKDIGRRLRQLRLREDLTQSQLAEAAGLDLRNYQNLEQGKSNFRFATLLKLAAFYHVTAESILKGSRSAN